MSRRSTAAAWLLLAAAGCATARVASDRDLAALSGVEYAASFDEVYDAAWLSLEKSGHRVVSHDRRQGTFATEPVGDTGYEVQVTPREDRVRLEVVPRRYGDGKPVLDDGLWKVDGPGGEAERWALLHTQVRALLDAWKTVPEFDYRKVGHVLAAAGVRLPLPESWNTLELRTDRRRFRLQEQKRADQGRNPTLLVVLDRRRPNPEPLPLLEEAAQLAVPDAHPELAEAFAAAPQQPQRSGELVWVGQEFLFAAEPFDLDCFTFAADTHAWTIRFAAVCPRPATTENASDAACVQAVRSVGKGAHLVVQSSE